ncbi:hypothetical protein [Cloacibacterium sp.]|uniref:hypothetical protein n=1 Tax=Cloacibacterium sp. TaxID=1913682 RepID=UPI0039E5AB1F
MKRNKRFLIVVLLLIFIRINSQVKIESTDNLKCRIENSGQSYVGKTLQSFLTNIGMDIKMVTYERINEGKDYDITLLFITKKEYNKLRSQKILPARVVIYFEDNQQTRRAYDSLEQYGYVENEKIPYFLDQLKNLLIKDIRGSEDAIMK